MSVRRRGAFGHGDGNIHCGNACIYAAQALTGRSARLIFGQRRELVLERLAQQQSFRKDG